MVSDTEACRPISTELSLQKLDSNTVAIEPDGNSGHVGYK